jgi:hypothetical protein
VLPLLLKREQAHSEWQSWLAGDAPGGALEYWLGPTPLRADQLENADPQGGWWLAQESGMAVCEMSDWVLRLDASPLGFGSMAAHGHCDALHLSIWAGAEALIIDPGTGGYYGMAARRAELAAWDAHNGPQPAEGFVTPRRAGTFLLTHHHAAPELQRISPSRVKARLRHEGQDYTRIVDIGKDGVLNVEDQAAGDAPFKVRWTFAPECLVSGGRMLVYQIKRGSHVWKLELGGEIISYKTGETMVSRSYGKLEPAATLEIVAKGALTSEWRRG